MAANTTPTGVWLITGCSSGFGRTITLDALGRGERVIAASRRPAELSELEAAGATALQLDPCASDDAVAAAVKRAHAVHGRLDVLVNNAGYILEGAVETCSGTEVADQYEVNVFGPLRVLRAVLPYLRAQRSGIVCNMGSIGGWRGTPFGGLYCSTKWALAALTQSLKAELMPLGVEVVIVEPGYFRTDFLTSKNRVSSTDRVPDYSATMAAQRKVFDSYSRKQPGDPTKGAAVIVDLLTRSGPWAQLEHLPWRVPLGKDAAGFIRDTIDGYSAEHDKYVPLTDQTNCDDV